MRDDNPLAVGPNVSRRMFLRGAAGFSLVSPWLDSQPLRAADTGKRAASKTKLATATAKNRVENAA